ncbi:MAG: uroporphyrinogen-III synthase [Parvularculaceae bacterium]
MKIILTRPEEDAAALAEAVIRMGGEPVISPTLKIQYRDEKVALLPDEALAFTSANGVRAYCRLSPERNRLVYVVGSATAATARQNGFALIKTADGDAKSLAALIALSKRSNSIVHFAGEKRAVDLSEALAGTGVKSRAVVVYAAVPTMALSVDAAAALRSNPEKTAVTFFSPRSAALFLQQAGEAGLDGQLGQSHALCLSEAVAAAAGDNWRDKQVTTGKSSVAMTDLLKKLIQMTE